MPPVSINGLAFATPLVKYEKIAISRHHNPRTNNVTEKNSMNKNTNMALASKNVRWHTNPKGGSGSRLHHFFSNSVCGLMTGITGVAPLPLLTTRPGSQAPGTTTIIV